MKKVVLLMALAACALAGCITDTSGVRVENARLIVDNPRFASHLTMTHQLRRGSQGFLHVQAWLQNADRGDIAFQYRFEWLDKEGFLLAETSPMWHTARLHGRDRAPLEGVSESREAADFRLVVRPL